MREPRTVQSVDGWHRPGLAVTVAAAVAVVLAIAYLGLHRESAGLPQIARHAMEIALPTWGTTEVVNEIVYGSRGFDTFGETFLLLAAVVSVTTLTRSREPRDEYVGEATAGRREQQRVGAPRGTDRGERTARSAEAEEDEEDEEDEDPPLPDPDSLPLGDRAPERAAAMTVFVRTAARTAAVPLAVAGVYLMAWGYTPGGGFPAGAALTGIAVLLYAALGHRAVRAARPGLLEPVEMFGAAVIIGIGLVGLAVDGSFLVNWLPLAPQQTIRSGGTLQAFSAAELIEVGCGLTIAIFALLGMEHDWTAPDDSDGSTA